MLCCLFAMVCKQCGLCLPSQASCCPCQAIYVVNGEGDLLEAFANESGNFDPEVEQWRDSQVSSGWMSAAYRAYPRMEERANSTPIVVVNQSGEGDEEVAKSTGLNKSEILHSRTARSRSRGSKKALRNASNAEPTAC